MSQGFKLRFDQLKDNNPTKFEDANLANNDSYNIYSHIRNLCMIWPDNTKKFLNYAYLVSGDYLPDEGRILLGFTTHAVDIKGTNLEELFDDLMDHLPRKIICVGERYKSTVDNQLKAIIETIEVTPNA